MTRISTIAEAEAVLARYMPAAREITGKDITLVRMVPLMQALGNPQDKLKVIHIAGTSGKTSTSYYVASLLHAAEQKVGLTVSPHIDSITERLQINMKPVNERVFCDALSEFIELIKSVDPEPTYFELLVAFTFWYFAKVGVDYAVMETGLGGLHDTTNVAKRADKLCIITDIGIDHTHVLGHTLPEITGQKAGIIHDGNNVVMYRQADEIMDVVTNWCSTKHAELVITSQATEHAKLSNVQELDALPIFQQRNWLLAHRAYEFLQFRDDLPSILPDELTASFNTFIPGRMETHEENGKTLVLDGAHNAQKMQSFVISFKALYPDQKAAVLLSLKEGKEYKSVLPLLQPITSRLILTSFAASQNLPVRAIDPHQLASLAKAEDFENVVVEPDEIKAYQLLHQSPEELLVVTGSFYLIGQLKSRLRSIQ